MQCGDEIFAPANCALEWHQLGLGLWYNGDCGVMNRGLMRSKVVSGDTEP